LKKKKQETERGDFREKKVEKQRRVVLKTETERRRNIENAKKGRRITVFSYGPPPALPAPSLERERTRHREDEGGRRGEKKGNKK
jgi:hypothetical protein